MAQQVSTTFSGTIEIYSDKFDCAVKHLSRAAERWGIELTIGEPRTVASRGIFCRRYVSLASVEGRSTDERAVRDFSDFARVLVADLNRANAR